MQELLEEIAKFEKKHFGIVLRLYGDGSGSVFEETARMDRNDEILFTFDNFEDLKAKFQNFKGEDSLNSLTN